MLKIRDEVHSVPTSALEEAESGPQARIPSLYTVGTLAVLFGILIVGMAPKIDTDLWWHLKVGEYIAAHHAVPVRDYLSFTFANHPWTDHEWLTDLIFIGLYRIAGLWGDIAFFACVICGTYALVYRRVYRLGVHPVLGLFLLCLACIPSSPTWGARAQMLTLLFLALYGVLLDRYRSTADRKVLVALPLLMVLWSNLHGGWVLGLVFLVLTAVGETLNLATHREGSLTNQDCRLLWLAAAGCLVAPILNPYGIRVLLYPLVWLFPTSYSNLINEWVSTDFHMPQMMVFEALLLLLVASVFVGRPRMDWVNVLLILAFTHLALSQSRNVAVWSVVITPILAAFAQRSTEALRRDFPRLQYRRRPVSRHVAPYMNLTLLALCAILYLVEAGHFINNAALRKNESDTYPMRAVAYMQHHHVSTNVFAAYAWGGYVLWKLFPKNRDFIDGRANTLFGERLLQDYVSVGNGAFGWDRILASYHANAVLIPTDTTFENLLAASRNWRLRYRDDQAVLYEHR